MLPEALMARVLGAITTHRAGPLSCVEAGELLVFPSRRLRSIYRRTSEISLPRPSIYWPLLNCGLSSVNPHSWNMKNNCKCASGPLGFGAAHMPMSFSEPSGIKC